MPINNSKNLSLRSVEVDAVITSAPKWIIRWGITVIAFCILIVIWLCYFIKFPNVIIAPVTLGCYEDPVTLIVPSERGMKIKAGQSVHIKARDFSYLKYGVIKGKVKSVSFLSTGRKATIQITLVNGLMTSSKKEIPCLNDLNGIAEIVIGEISLLDKIFLVVVES